MGLELRVTHLSGSREGELDTFRTLPVKVGRSQDCPLQFDPVADARVSVVHAELRESGGLLEIVDLGSQNGTTVNGVAIGHQQAFTVPNNSVLELGTGGPKVRIEYEEAAGVHFGRLESEQRSKVVQRKPVPTERHKAYTPAQPEPATQRFKELAEEVSSNGPLVLMLLVAVVVVGLIVVALVVLS